MISVSNLSIHFSNRYLFKNISFSVVRNSRIGLIGRNGTGKTTLLKILYGIESPEEGSIVRPTGYLTGYLPQEGKNDSSLSVYDEVRQSLSEIYTLEQKINDITDELSARNDYSSSDYQNLLNKFTDLTERYKILGGNSIEAEIESVLKGLGFVPDDFYKKVSEFSGGWQMRIELAKILLNKPDCILLDEPTNHLDIESIQWLQQFLKGYYGSVIIVSHDRNFLNTATNRTIEIANGKIYDLPVPYSEFIQLRKEQKEHQLAAFKNQQKQIEETEKFIERFRYKATLASRVQSRVKQLEKIDRIELDDEDVSSIKLKFPEPPRSGRLVAEIRHLSKAFGDNLVLSDVHLAVERGDKIAFVGKNGEGKSTLSRIFAGREDFDGHLEFGYNVQTGYFAQHQAELLDSDNNVFDVIDKVATGDMRTHIRSLLGAFLFSGDSIYKKVKVLSGGEKSRLALARMLLQPVNFLILDEPTNHLDMVAKDVLKSALLAYSGALIVVSHDVDFLSGLTDKTVYFSNKTLKEYPGSIQNFLEQHNLETLKALEIQNKQKNFSEQETVKKDKIARIQQKEFQREENRLKKLIASLENEIEELEQKLDEYNKIFSDPAIFADIENANRLKAEFEELRESLENKMQDWHIAGEALEEWRNSSLQ